MISQKLSNPKLQERLFNPQGKHRWMQATLARGIKVTILKAIEGRDEIWITEFDAKIIRKVAEVLGTGNPAFNPFSGGAALLGDSPKMAQSPDSIRRALS